MVVAHIETSISSIVNPKSFAVVTGACSGIGLEFAKELASRGYPIVAVSNKAKELTQVSNQISCQHKVEVIPFCIDLSKTNAAQVLFECCKDLRVDVVINNAGVFSFADLSMRPLSDIDLVTGLQINTLTKISLLFGEKMKAQGGGYILNSSSMAGYFSFPGIALYNASKSYVRVLSKSLWYEYIPYNISITALCPGAVATTLYGLKPSLMKLGVRLGIISRPEKMVKKALRGMFKRKRVVMPYPLVNRFIQLFVQMLPSFMVKFAYKKLKRFQK
jgi:short-subunit dehydrogenase